MSILVASSPVAADRSVQEGGIWLVDGGRAQRLAATGSTAWLTGHPTLPVLYAIGREVDGRDGDAATGIPARGVSEVRAWTVTGGIPAPELVPLATIPLTGDGPCHVVATHDALYVAYYTAGEVSRIDLGPDGTPVAGSERRAAFAGTGPDAERQESAHPHQVVRTADGSILAVDLGADVLRLLDAQTLAETDRRTTLPGSGPRHAVEIAPGTWAVACELDSTVALVTVSGEARTAPSTRVRADTRNYPSDIVALDDHRVVVANRGADTLTLLTVRGDDLAPAAEWPAGGAWPQAFALTPVDAATTAVSVALRDFDAVAIHHVTGETGALAHTVPVPRPTALVDLAGLVGRAADAASPIP